MTNWLVMVLQAAALRHVERCELGRKADAGFDAGEFSDGPRPGEEAAYDLLGESDYWRRWDLGDTHDWLCHDGDHDDCDGGCDCFCDPVREQVYRSCYGVVWVPAR